MKDAETCCGSRRGAAMAPSFLFFFILSDVKFVAERNFFFFWCRLLFFLVLVETTSPNGCGKILAVVEVSVEAVV